MSRTAERQALHDETWKRLVERDLDDHDDRFEEVLGRLDELKETLKWNTRTMLGLLVSTIVLLATVIATAVVR